MADDDAINSDPNAQMIDPPSSAEEMDAFIKTLESDFEYSPTIDLSTFNPKGALPNDPEDDPSPDDDETPEETPEETPDDDADTVLVNGQPVPRAEVERLMAFDKYLRDNPDAAQRVTTALAPPAGSPLVPTSTSEADKVDEWTDPEPPEGLDLEDPTTKFLWDQTVASRKDTWTLGQQFRQTQQSIIEQNEAAAKRQAQADLDTALTQFRTQFTGINDDDMAVIRSEASVVLPGILKTMGETPAALFRAMEIAGYANADMRAKMDSPTPTPTSRQRSTTRKQRLNSISGSPRSAPKVENARPVYTSDRDMVNEFANALADNGMGR